MLPIVYSLFFKHGITINVCVWLYVEEKGKREYIDTTTFTRLVNLACYISALQTGLHQLSLVLV